jgi:tRNA pseudouridine55 synthase
MPDCQNCPKTQTAGERGWAAPRRAVPLSGILSVDKPSGMTSHDVVDCVRRWAGQRRVGHAGTLDPLATGLLLICLGAATRMAEYLVAGGKRYRAGIVLGISTDTYDSEGQVVQEGGRTDWAMHEIDSALALFRGQIEQIPPMYSAIKQGGQPLYRRARRGEVVERATRAVEIDELTVLDWTPPLLIVEVACSPGTYIRSLAHDLGQDLGCGAHLASLVRLSSGRFSLEDAVSLSRLEEAFQHGQEEQYLLAPDEAVLDWPAVIVDAQDAHRILHGAPIAAELLPEATLSTGLRAYDCDGRFLALLTRQPATGQWRTEKLFGAPEPEEGASAAL